MAVLVTFQVRSLEDCIHHIINMNS